MCRDVFLSSPIIYDTNGIVTIKSMFYLHSGIPTTVHWKFKKNSNVCPKNSYVCPSFSYIQFSILTYCLHFLFLTLPFPFTGLTPFHWIIVTDLIKCFSTEVDKSTELTPNWANSAFEIIGVTSLVPKMINSSQSVLNWPSECANS